MGIFTIISITVNFASLLKSCSFQWKCTYKENSLLYIYIYIERERERETKTETETERKRQR